MMIFILGFVIWWLIGFAGLYVLDRVSTVPVKRSELCYMPLCGIAVWLMVLCESGWGDKPAFRKKKND
jgi:hypothetical protein